MMSSSYQSWSKAELVKEIDRLKKSVKSKRYGITWMEVPEAFEKESENKIPTLKEATKLSIDNDEDKPTHILIEGDNYHALTCLNYTHKEKVDLVYIDPPYNTGSDGFHYRDKRISDKFPDGTDVPKDHPFRHSYWLSFMRKRLELAKNLLTKDGLFVTSIDINELPQLKLLLDQVFNESNLVSLIAIKVKDPAGVGQQSYIFDVCEYLLVYANDINEFKKSNPDLPSDLVPLKDQYGSYTKMINDFGTPQFVEEINRQNVGKIEIYTCKNAKISRTTEMPLKDYAKNRKVIFADYNPNGGMILAIKDKIPKQGLSYIEYVPTKGQFAGQKTKTYFLNGRIVAWLSSVTQYEGKTLRKISKMTNFWEMPNASLHLEGGVDFTNGKKPLKLLQKVVGLVGNKDATILDFFAGSGTTGEAVCDLNTEDGGTRQSILVTNNDEVTTGSSQHIMTDVCYPRMKNTVSGYNSKAGTDDSIKYYQTSFIGNNDITNYDDQDAISLACNAGELLALAENTLKLVHQDKYSQIFKGRTGYTAIYFREELDQYSKFVDSVMKLNKKASVYVFSWGGSPSTEEFDGASDVTVKTIPKPILEIYKQIYNLENS